jgi:hypothetical protein
MGFEEFFDNDRKDYRNNRENRYPEDNDYQYNPPHSFDRNGDNVKWHYILQKIRSNRKLRLLVISGGILVLIIVIVLIITLLPLLGKLINYITLNGLQGIINEITGFIDKIMKGTAN